MFRFISAIAVTVCLATVAQAAPLDCTTFLTGHWTGKGDITMFGTKTLLDNVYTYNADGSFTTVNRFKNGDDAWQEQSISGTWTATPGEDATSCTVKMSSTFDSGGATGTSSSSSTITQIDADTYSSMDFAMHRAAAN